MGSKTSLLTFALVLAGNRILIHFMSGHMEISVHQRFQAPREQRERATHASRLEFFSLIISKQCQSRMCCHHAKHLLTLRSSHLSFTSKPDICVSMICIRASCLQAKGRQCYLSQNIGPALAESSGPAPPLLQRFLFECC